MWIVYALLSAFFASLVAIFGKIGLRSVDTTIATTIRAIIMATVLILITFSIKKFNGFSVTSLSGKEWMYISIAGIAGALSWLCYFIALKQGTVVHVAAIDRSSVLLATLFAVLFLGESLTWKSGLGVICIAIGTILMIL